jgi:hypothetical protein
MKLPDRAYHLAEESNWPSIQRHGLLSATRLLRAAGLTGAERRRLERAQRPDHTELPSGVHIRDQRPMPADALARCLSGMSPAEWYAMVNARVFFWFDPERMNRQRAACGLRPQVVLVVDAPALSAAHADRVALTPINTGNARRRPARRGAATFVPLSAWQHSGWAGEAEGLGIRPRQNSHRPVELTVRDAVPDIMRFVVQVVPLPSGKTFLRGAA